MTYYIDSTEKEGIMKLLTENNAGCKEYESYRANVLQEIIWKVFAAANTDKETMSKEDKKILIVSGKSLGILVMQ